MTQGHKFGGVWTREKLERLRKYLIEYMKIMNKHPYFKVAYIDAFAGTGYIELPEVEDVPVFDATFQEEVEGDVVKGSAVIALEIEPHFHNYIFIESQRGRAAELELLKKDYPNLASRISIKMGDANVEVQELCRKNWRHHRAVLFLDPYGMQVEWSTIEAIANTKAIDLWILFPSAIAVNRVLTRDGNIPPNWKASLDSLFGSSEWVERFYVRETQAELFGPREINRRVATLEDIEIFFLERLMSVFPCVAQNPLSLTTREGRPLYRLYFACANEKGSRPALRIAEYILGR